MTGLLAQMIYNLINELSEGEQEAVVIDNLSNLNKNCLDITILSDNKEVSLQKADIKGKETVLDIFQGQTDIVYSSS